MKLSKGCRNLILGLEWMREAVNTVAALRASEHPKHQTLTGPNPFSHQASQTAVQQKLPSGFRRLRFGVEVVELALWRLVFSTLFQRFLGAT